MASIIWFLLKAMLLPLPLVDASPNPEVVVFALTAEERLAGIPVEPLLDAVGVQPGSVVLDIGAGAGLLLSELTRRVGPSGRVIATEIGDPLMARLQEKQRADSMSNLEVFKVTPVGLDPLYKKHTYDLVLLVGVYEFMIKPWDFFCEFKALLNTNGRIVIVHPKMYPPLSENMYFDVDYLSRALKKEGEYAPLMGFMSHEVRESLADTKPMDKAMFPLLVRDLNAAMSKPEFTLAMLKRSKQTSDFGVDGLLQEISPQYRPLFRWLIGRCGQAFHKPSQQLTPDDKEGIRVINWVILASKYIYPEISMAGFVLKEDPIPGPLEVKSDFENCGYRYLGQKNVLHFYDVLVFGL